jgi:hypothetical protein
MMNFRGFILLVLLGICVLFVVQNLPPVSLVFFGSNPVTLPLSIWIVLFTGAGLISSLIIQALNNLSSLTSAPDNIPQKPSSYSPPSPAPSSPSTSPTATIKNTSLEEKPAWENYSPEKINSRSESVKMEKINNFEADWELEHRERPWPQGEQRQETIETNQTESNQEVPNFEVQQTPQTKSRSASLYSYKYRERSQIRPKFKPKSQPKDEVYDANYRVITPPYRDNNQPINEDEDEEWDF